MENDFYHVTDQLLSVIGKLDGNPTQAKKSDREGDFSLEDAREALSCLQEVLPNNEYPWYVISGTFLGLHREGGFLKHDYDIDVGINIEDVNATALIRKLAMAPEFAVKKVDHHLKIIKGQGKLFSVQKDIALIKLVHASGINIDIFVHHLEDGVIWHGSSIHRWENTPYDLEERELDGVPVLAPRQADQYLTENYGDWRVPVKSFDCTLSTPNLTITKSFLSVALFIKRLYVFSKTEPQDARQLKQRLIENRVIREVAGKLYANKYI
ncbi:hypothetical protein CR158_11705 [Halomonas heilongjiangensis]|uniref:LicD/FKTN/FKRP nucleotidyltransferase domain-containing protein n=2 Tax=Halomonas heilongjiangensis TaxID=1387883 RepID=A0A2N7TJF6_9GAMM|nr:hypothetical protein C1H66_15635 [Halomonas heilongjiangensis]PXX89060.1 hypothetical protein CR158_11705 [Halomonas heilongjiangensis]